MCHTVVSQYHMSTERTGVGKPAISRQVRMIFYAGDGMMGGGLLYALVSLMVFVGFEFLAGGDLWIFGFILVVFLAIGLRNGWAIILANRLQLSRSDHPRIVVFREWKETRRWSWLLFIAIVVASTLAGITLTVWGWEEMSSGSTTEWIWIGAVGIGLALRWLALALATQAEASSELPL